jgi:exosortase K
MNALLGSLALTAAYVLKRMYSTAGADALGFILTPSCWVATALGGPGFVYESGAGYLSHEPRIVVGPACAGMNFLIVALLASYFSGARHLRGVRRVGWLAASALLAYVATLFTNGVRIAAASALLQADVYTDVITKPRLHLALGVVLYCCTLLAGCAVIERTLSGRRVLRTAPLLWYLAIVLLVPMLNAAWRGDPARFVEHALLTLGLCAAVAVPWWLGGRALDRVRSRQPT